jgi:hypothetical protein
MQIGRNKKRELFQVHGDAPEPGGNTRGLAGTYDLSSGVTARPVVYYSGRFGEFVLTIDLYQLPDGQTPPYLLLICPVCSAAAHRDPQRREHGLKICRSNKVWEYDPARMPKFPGMTAAELAAGLGLAGPEAVRGTLSCEPIACTFEAEPDLQRSFGMARCGFAIRIDNSIARDV